jgi:hypothetical protein
MVGVGLSRDGGWDGLSLFFFSFLVVPIASYCFVVQLVICSCFLTYMSQWGVVAPLARPFTSLCATSGPIIWGRIT